MPPSLWANAWRLPRDRHNQARGGPQGKRHGDGTGRTQGSDQPGWSQRISGPQWVARTSCCRRMCGIIQLQWHIQENPEEQAHPETLYAICRSTRTLHRHRRHGNDLEDGDSVSRRPTNARWCTTSWHPSSFPDMERLNVSSVWTTRMTQHTQLKMTNETWGCRVRHMSPTITWHWATPSPLLENSRRWCVAVVTRGAYKQWYAATWPTSHRLLNQRLSTPLAPTAPQLVNPTTNAELQLWSVWGWHHAIIYLRTSTRVTQLSLMQLIPMPMSRQQ